MSTPAPLCGLCHHRHWGLAHVYEATQQKSDVVQMSGQEHRAEAPEGSVRTALRSPGTSAASSPEEVMPYGAAELRDSQLHDTARGAPSALKTTSAPTIAEVQRQKEETFAALVTEARDIENVSREQQLVPQPRYDEAYREAMAVVEHSPASVKHHCRWCPDEPLGFRSQLWEMER